MYCNAGLVLEGGGMKAMFTAGVLDFFHDNGVVFSRIYAVSAAADHVTSYMSRQRGRAFATFTDYQDRWDFCSIRSLVLTGDLFNVKMCYDTIPRRLNPFDFDTMSKYPGQMYAVVTNVRTGLPEYKRISDLRRDMRAVRASGSLPVVARKVRLGRDYYLDGGLSDGIPFLRSLKKGFMKNVVVLTKVPGYRARQDSMFPIIRLIYHRCPELVETVNDHPRVYNMSLDAVESCEKTGESFVLRPKRLFGVGRVEHDVKKLTMLYEEGYRSAADSWDRLKSYLDDTVSPMPDTGWIRED